MKSYLHKLHLSLLMGLSVASALNGAASSFSRDDAGDEDLAALIASGIFSEKRQCITCNIPKLEDEFALLHCDHRSQCLPCLQGEFWNILQSGTLLSSALCRVAGCAATVITDTDVLAVSRDPGMVALFKQLFAQESEKAAQRIADEEAKQILAEAQRIEVEDAAMAQRLYQAESAALAEQERNAHAAHHNRDAARYYHQEPEDTQEARDAELARQWAEYEQAGDQNALFEQHYRNEMAAVEAAFRGVTFNDEELFQTLADRRTQEQTTPQRTAQQRPEQTQQVPQAGPSAAPETQEDEDPAAEKECSVCFTEVPAADFVRLHCRHNNTCRDCVRQGVVDIALRERTTDRLICPERGCGAKLTDADIDLITNKNIDIMNQLFDIQFIEYLRTQHMVQCPTPDCPNQFFNEDGQRVRVTCAACRQSFCSECRLDHSNRISCAEAQEMRLLTQDPDGAEAASVQWQINNTKPCARCGIGVMKAEGCNHITCKSCKHHFCWLCNSILPANPYRGGVLTCGCPIHSHS